MDAPQFTANGETFVVIPLSDYERLRRLAEEADDEADEAVHRRINDDYLADRARGEDLSMPRDQWARIRAGDSPVRVIREYRGLTQAQLGELAGVDQSQISTIENGKRQGAIGTLKALAKALRSPMDVLVEGI